MRVVIRWRFPLADVLSSPGQPSKPAPSSEAAALSNEVQWTNYSAVILSKLWFAPITTHVMFGISGTAPRDLKGLHPEPVEELAPLDPSFIGRVRVFVVVGDVGKPAQVQQEASPQQNIPAGAAAYAP